jgi:membrane-bound serine protease (ClpP class)
LFFAFSVYIIHKLVIPAYRRKTTTGREGLIGLEGIVVEPLRPAGLIKVKSEYWRAESLKGSIESGEKVEITGSRGMVLKVKRLDSPVIKRYDSSNTSNI